MNGDALTPLSLAEALAYAHEIAPRYGTLQAAIVCSCGMRFDPGLDTEVVGGHLDRNGTHTIRFEEEES